MANIKSIIILLTVITVLLGLTVINPNRVGGSDQGDNVTGWLWAGSTHDDIGTPSLDTLTGLGWITLTSHNTQSACAGPEPNCFGLVVPPATNCSSGNIGCPLDGFVWSSQLGWIWFKPSPEPQYGVCGYPAQPCKSVERFFDSLGGGRHRLRGWARICSAAANPDCTGGPNPDFGGYEGWIKFGVDPPGIPEINKRYTGDIFPPKGTPPDEIYNGVTIVDDLGNPNIKYLKGYAWSNELGWIRFGGLTISVSHNPIVSFEEPPPPSQFDGELISSIFDTCALDANCGVSMNTLMWQGDIKIDGRVAFRVAASDSLSGPWNPGDFVGPDGTETTVYEPDSSVPDTIVLKPPSTPTVDFSNKRYFRYKVLLKKSLSGESPIVNDIIINWSP